MASYRYETDKAACDQDSCSKALICYRHWLMMEARSRHDAVDVVRPLIDEDGRCPMFVHKENYKR